MECTKSGEDEEGAKKNQRVVYLQQWMCALSERKKRKEPIRCIYGIYNTTGGAKSSGQDAEKCVNNSLPCQSKGIIYERLCLGVRYLEMVVLREWKTEKGKNDLHFACGDGCIYSAGDFMEEVNVFLLSNKKEKVLLSFLLRPGMGDNNDDKGHDDADHHDSDNDGDNYPHDQPDNDNVTQLLDIYMYLYLRREVKHSERDENYRVLYFLNDREKFLNLEKYQFDIDHFQIRNWVFNNMSLLLPSGIVHGGGEVRSSDEGEVRIPDGGETFPLEGKANLHSPQQQCTLFPEEEEKEKAENTLTPFVRTPQRERSSLLSLPQEHHMSLFRLNSMQNDQVPILSSKICIKRKFPNILITRQEGDYEVADSEEKDSIHVDEIVYRRTNARRYYIEWEGDHHNGGTLHEVHTHDGNLSSSGKFIGSNNLPLTEYIIDVPRYHKLLNSPFTFLNKKLVYLCEEGECLKGKCAHGMDTNNTYYVIKTVQTVQRSLTHLQSQFNADMRPSWICILAQDFRVQDIFDVICVNFRTPAVFGG
ncbi:conserved Plasmodium protein, unknown function [Plasmodium knowlesi strain H]|uniref:Uncharacterized protein n=2 Tax=Plasmodium knowlesi (strain H) TaxID=5851 RepID=A0A5K1VFE2_PLAKH|nr:conserved Plasmodium protein, unknown function [Plasmodium knowlesi strain H]CAA9989388.1 conserved Plasmodium protein, unknown function [Plasmodium knowlesi strain H]SBO24980.1 conserved Plasmodium protein, unknown function [Plasmodium knowlesi strain H]SBO27884.1 conserved Plasmodium protein, unknown function [Plasmodium knowlesi strain H]VVS78862.1 conserved Plasmodium protein, unknown function [Plasmodium knowlesi strain H]|eukprot:XP_002260115.1 hypothetical protein, conserved in Plasmodium species [Plasmodium knowlesi strain H]